MKKKFNVNKLDEFKSEIKKISKKLTTIEEDLKNLIEFQIKPYHFNGIDNKGIFPITGIGIKDKVFYKVKKFTCKSMKGKGVNTGLRLIYTFIESENKLDLIEIYRKQRKKNEDRKRILKYY